MNRATDQAAALVAQAHATARALADLLNVADAVQRAALAEGASREAVAHAARAYAFAEAAASAARNIHGLRRLPRGVAVWEAA